MISNLKFLSFKFLYQQKLSFEATFGWIFGQNSGPQTRFWECWGEKSFACFGEQYTGKFSEKDPWKSTISEVHPPTPIPSPLPLCQGTWNSQKIVGFCLKFWPVMTTCKLMQQMCYRFYWIRPKSQFFDSFWVFMLIPSYTLWFTTWGQIKDFVKIYIW